MAKEEKHKFFDQEKYQKLVDGYNGFCHSDTDYEYLNEGLKSIGFEGLKFFYDNFAKIWNNPKEFIQEHIESRIKNESGGLKYVADMIRKECDSSDFPEIIERFKRDKLRDLGRFDLHNRIRFYSDFKIEYLKFDAKLNKLVLPPESLEKLKEECWFEISSSQLEVYNKVVDAINTLSDCFGKQSLYSSPRKFLDGIIKTNVDYYPEDMDRPSIFFNEYHEDHLKMNII